MLPLLRAFLNGDRDFDVRSVDPSAMDRALRIGLGPIVAYVSREADLGRHASRLPALDAADLAARLLMDNLLDTAVSVLRAARSVGCHPVVLKGCATAPRLYPAPHLRATGDIDLLVSPAEAAAIESELRHLGFIQRSARPAAAYQEHHHTMPFWHAQRGVWVEVHTRLFPPASPLARDRRLDDGLDAQLTWGRIRGEACRVMRDELQLVYTASRWAAVPDEGHGVFPLLDAALIVHQRGTVLDWDRICDSISGSWANTAVCLTLGYLAHARLAPVPSGVLARLAGRDPYSNRLLARTWFRLVTDLVVEGRPPGPVLTPHALRLVWSALVAPHPPWQKTLRLPFGLAFPPDQTPRFDPRLALSRLGAVVRRALTAEKSKER